MQQRPQSVAKEQNRIAKNSLEICLLVMDAINNIRSMTGHGSIKLDVKNGLVVYTEVTYRDHLTGT